MRIVFLALLLTASLLYSYYAYDTLSFLTTTGRLGPGFFPRIIGTLLVVLCLAALISDRRSAADEGDIGVAADAWSVAAMVLASIGYLVALRLVGGVVGTVIFLLVILSIFNRGRYFLNATLSVAVPACLYLLFVVTLNADMPEGLLPLPF
ncbi:hypothetical protein GCM10007276_01510 [Agaricicola taiwanensis]|uniref:DUF1468 domain-containing protein n=1 Tax=Agaricicola taiwanensis TaxID=591372 RepID=A0A8J2YBH1_9RHOB|nr:tripartite tricarboxylate transporter TctB family protein [Agaricicola taiwanensis]GGE28022.1 hypothetical protein GCM10007276_01510 [Agaricicola taiwanensis]